MSASDIDPRFAEAHYQHDLHVRPGEQAVATPAAEESIEDVKQAYALLFKENATLRARVEGLEKLVSDLKWTLTNARDDMEDWGSYASDYFREKYNLAGDLAAITEALLKETQ
jgi:hypothetical protein